MDDDNPDLAHAPGYRRRHLAAEAVQHDIRHSIAEPALQIGGGAALECRAKIGECLSSGVLRRAIDHEGNASHLPIRSGSAMAHQMIAA